MREQPLMLLRKASLHRVGGHHVRADTLDEGDRLLHVGQRLAPLSKLFASLGTHLECGLDAIEGAVLLGLAHSQVRRFDRTRILPEPEMTSRQPRGVQVIAERIARDDALQHRHALSRVVSVDEIKSQGGRLSIDEERRLRLARERKPTFAQGSGLGSFLEIVIGRGHRGQALDHPVRSSSACWIVNAR